MNNYKLHVGIQLLLCRNPPKFPDWYHNTVLWSLNYTHMIIQCLNFSTTCIFLSLFVCRLSKFCVPGSQSGTTWTLFSQCLFWGAKPDGAGLDRDQWVSASSGRRRPRKFVDPFLVITHVLAPLLIYFETWKNPNIRFWPVLEAKIPPDPGGAGVGQKPMGFCLFRAP